MKIVNIIIGFFKTQRCINQLGVSRENRELHLHNLSVFATKLNYGKITKFAILKAQVRSSETTETGTLLLLRAKGK
jgi:hypothetical protein